jgi:hypothetical protein
MALSNRARRAGAKKAQGLLPGATVVEYAIGRSGPNPVVVALAILGGFIAFSVAIALATGAVVFPGILVFLIIHHYTSPPRGVAVCREGLAVTDRSLLNGKPNKLITRTSHGDLRPVDQAGSRTLIQIGPEQVWLTAKELEVVRRSSHATGGPVDSPYATPPGMAPPTAPGSAGLPPIPPPPPAPGPG